MILLNVYLWKAELKKVSVKLMYTGIWLLFIGMVIVQLFALIYTPASVFHDPVRVYFQAEQLALGHHDWGALSYFWRYPNNAPLAIILSWFVKLTNFVHIPLNIMVDGLALLFYDGFVASILYMARKLKQTPVLRLGLISIFALAPLSYTYAIQVFYSDIPVLLLLTWISYFIIRWASNDKQTRLWQGALLVILVMMAQIIKPNLVVFAVAVILWVLWTLINRKMNNLKVVLIPALLVMLGFGLSVPVKSAILNSAQYTTNAKYELPPTSWINMGLNRYYGGVYAEPDVKKLLNMPDKAVREKYLKEAIPKRLDGYKSVELVKHFACKFSIFTDGSTLPQSYTGGHTNSPAWYQKNQRKLSDVALILQQILWSSFYFFTFLTIWKNLWRKNSAHLGGLQLLMSLTLLGYVTFHTFIWETEARYGLIMLPLLMMIIFIAKQSDQDELPLKQPLKPILSGIISALSVGIVLWIGISQFGAPEKEPQDVVVNAQRSQFSVQYGARPLQLRPNQFIEQTVDLKTRISNLAIQMPENSTVTGTLINEKNHKIITLKYDKQWNGEFLINSKAFPAGKYRIKIVNNTTSLQPVWVVNLENYQLAPYYVHSNQSVPGKASLIYTFYGRQ